MTTTDEVNFDAPVAKAKKKPAKKARAAAEPKPVGERFPGMTRISCGDKCGKDGCAIGTSYCAHPTKGGLQSPDMNNPVLLRRMQEARSQLNVQIDKNRFT